MINIKGKEYEIFEIPKPSAPYLILELLNKEKQ